MRTALAALVFAACARPAPAPSAVDAGARTETPTNPPLEAAPVPTPPIVDAGRAPLAPPHFVELPDAVGFLAVPVGARTPRPIMIALHGGSDRPDWACGSWGSIASGFAFVVCPRGAGTPTALVWTSPADTRARIERAIAAAKNAYGDWVLPTETYVLTGFSMGATQVALLAQSEPKRYRRISLCESAYAPKPATDFARPWAQGGGERVLFSCSTPGCEGTYRACARNAAAQHVPARLNLGGTTAHGMWEQVQRSMRRDWGWLVQGAEGWEDFVPSTDESPGRSEIFDAR